MAGIDKLLREDFQRNPRLIEWEPYKAANGSSFQHNLPLIPSQLIAYEINSDIPPKCRPDFLDLTQLTQSLNGPRLISGNNMSTAAIEIKPEDDEQTKMIKEIQMLKKELNIERDVNHELKRLLVNSLREDLNSQLSSLTEDKVRLSKNIENQEDLRIESTLWKSKFMAISIRADDLSYNLNVALKLLKRAQLVIADLSNNVQSKSGELGKTICDLLNIDVLSFYNKLPCDERIRRPVFSSNLTINCCSRCLDKQIQLV